MVSTKPKSAFLTLGVLFCCIPGVTVALGEKQGITRRIVDKAELIALTECVEIKEGPSVEEEYKHEGKTYKRKGRRYKLIYKVVQTLKGPTKQKVAKRIFYERKEVNKGLPHRQLKRFEGKTYLSFFTFVNRDRKPPLVKIIHFERLPALPDRQLPEAVQKQRDIEKRIRALLLYGIEKAPGKKLARELVVDLIRFNHRFNLVDIKLLRKLSQNDYPVVRAHALAQRMIEGDKTSLRDALSLARRHPEIAKNLLLPRFENVLSVKKDQNTILNLLESEKAILQRIALEVLHNNLTKRVDWEKIVAEIIDFLKNSPKKRNQLLALKIIYKSTMAGPFGTLTSPVAREMPRPPAFPFHFKEFKNNARKHVQAYIHWWENNRHSLEEDSAGRNSTEKTGER